MRRRMGIVVLVLSWPLASCGPQASQFGCSEMPVTDSCSAGLEFGECMTQGGCWIEYYGGPGCQCPTRDGGKECSRAADCEGSCLVEGQTVDACAPQASGICSERRPMIGCYCFLDAETQVHSVCVD